MDGLETSVGAESNSPNKARVSREGKNCCPLGPVSSKVCGTEPGAGSGLEQKWPCPASSHQLVPRCLSVVWG